MNNLYAFVLGKHPALSIAEIYEVLKLKGCKFSFIDNSREILLLEVIGLDLNIIENLGGTIKIVQIINKISMDDYSPEFLLKNLEEELLKNNEPKQKIGFSAYSINSSKKKFNRISKSFRYFSINLKKNLKDKINLGFINIKYISLPSATVLKNGLVGKRGIEIDLILSSEYLYVGKTIAVQDIDLYTKLDMKRPKRDLVSGTTPPKLAKIMVNLSGKKTGSLLLDPFCGSGTYLQEMLLLGYRNVSGSDISSKAISDTKENLAWLQTEILREDILIEVTEFDARELSKKHNQKVIDAVICEGYLGPPIRGYMDDDKLKNIIVELKDLYSSVLKELHIITKGDARIVFALPVFAKKNGYDLLPIEDDLKRIGFKIINLTDKAKVSTEDITKRNSLLYSREDQFVYREILVLEKN